MMRSISARIQPHNLVNATCQRSFTTQVQLVWKTTVPGTHFSVTNKNGFFPASPPLIRLPTIFNPLTRISENISMQKQDGSPGLLGLKDVGRTIEEELPLIDVSKIADPVLLTALFREYSFTASSYLLEPAHHTLLETGKYGIARPSLPAALAIPLEHLGKKLGVFPFLDYANAYSLNNWKLVEPHLPIHYNNIKCMRLFNGCSDEQGFIATHSSMVYHSYILVNAGQEAILAASENDTPNLAKALRKYASGLEKIYDQFREMWRVCNPKAYLQFRTFIMGPLGNTEMFPKGVIYEGVDSKPRYYRGETGAQDSMLPATDNLLELHYPKNSLTLYLEDLRDYRPKDHRAYLEWIQKAAKFVQLKNTALTSSRASLALLVNLNILAKFRSQHWTMTKQYILNHTKFPRATGGTPITTYLPNLLGATLEYMSVVDKNITTLTEQGDYLTDDEEEIHGIIQAGLHKQIRKIKEEVIKMQDNEELTNQEVQEFTKRSSFKPPTPKSRLKV